MSEDEAPDVHLLTQDEQAALRYHQRATAKIMKAAWARRIRELDEGASSVEAPPWATADEAAARFEPREVRNRNRKRGR